MRGSLPVRRSRLADCARLAGALSGPVVLISLFGAIVGLVDGRALIGALVVGLALALLALILAACALTGIWMSGAPGARSASLAIFYAGPVLAVLAAVLAAIAFYPRLNDVSTDPADPPPLASSPAAGAGPARQAAAAAQMNAYPDLVPRLYGRSPAEVHAAIVDLVEARGWRIVEQAAADHGPPPSEPQSGSAEAAGSGGGPDIILQASVPMPLFDFSGTVVLRMRGIAEGTRVDMRSTWNGGAHDLGQNARRIKGFLSELDIELEAT